MKNPFKYSWFWSNPELVFSMLLGYLLGILTVLVINYFK